MPLLGEAPITVYMEKKSRTTHGGAGASISKPPLKKRKTDQKDNTKVTKCDPKASSSQGELPLSRYFSKSKATPQVRADSPTPGPITPRILNTRSKEMGNRQAQLQTPPMTVNGPSRQVLSKSTTSKPRPTPSCSKSPQQVTRESRSVTYPTPATTSRQYICSRNFWCDDETPCKQPNGPVVNSAASDLSSQHIPSSQTQPQLILNSTLQNYCVRQGSRLFSSGKEDSHPSNSVHDDLNSLIVESSQSQPPLYIPEHPPPDPIQLHSKEERRPGHNSISFESIPSSQSQEIEITIPSNVLGVKSECGKPSVQSMALSTKSQPILRTLSDDLFSVPIQYGILDEIFEPEDVESDLERSTHTVQSQRVDDDSATESDSQYEDFIKQLRDASKPIKKLDHDSATESDSQYEDFLNQIHNTPRYAGKPNEKSTTTSGSPEDHIQQTISSLVPSLTTSSSNTLLVHLLPGTPKVSSIKRKLTSLSQDSGYDASQGEDYSVGHLSSFSSQPAVVSQEGSPNSSSLDIRALFGNSQDSYPPDFPMSLR